MKVSPARGGCWFCCTDDSGSWLFSCEFDCNLHLHCLREAIAAGKAAEALGIEPNPELEIFAGEFSHILKESTTR